MTLSESRVSRGFLTVVPKGIRRAAAITVGDVLEWEMDEDRVVVRKRKRRTLSDVTGFVSRGGNAVDSKREVQGAGFRVV
jgi:bifunctional DNA-binding transcriptional regulator/antitoxin component of YhaV-PrlF toxin-antitoxin module